MYIYIFRWAHHKENGLSEVHVYQGIPAGQRRSEERFRSGWYPQAYVALLWGHELIESGYDYSYTYDYKHGSGPWGKKQWRCYFDHPSDIFETQETPHSSSMGYGMFFVSSKSGLWSATDIAVLCVMIYWIALLRHRTVIDILYPLSTNTWCRLLRVSETRNDTNKDLLIYCI